MRVFIFLLVFLPCYLLTISVQAALPPSLKPADIHRAPTAQAIVTFSGAQGRIHMMSFRNVPDLKSCFNLAWTAAAKGRESSATCIDTRGDVVSTFFCRPGKGRHPACVSPIPRESH